MLKLTTDKHEASRRLFATDELLVKPWLALAACRQYVYQGCFRRKIPHSSAARWQPRQGCKVP